MPIEVRVPTLGESVVDAVVGTWLKKEGESVKVGDALVELETDKVNIEVSAEQAGVLQQILKKEGETVGVGEVIAAIAEGAAEAVAAEAAPAEAAAAAPAPAAPAQPVAQPEVQVPVGVAQAAAAESAASAAQRATPTVRRLAAEYGIDLAQVSASGENGRITRNDVLRFAISRQGAAPAAQAANGAVTEAAPAVQPAAQTPAAPAPARPAPTPAAPAPAAAASDGRPEKRERMSRRRQTIAVRLVEAQQTAAMLTTFNEVDMSAVMDLRKRRRDAFRERHGVGLGFMSFFAKACVGALKTYPEVNGEIQGDEIVYKYYYDIGIAVGAPQGLIVPIVRDADRKTFAEIERDIEDLATRARDNQLRLDELMGGTFTITNGGVYGSLMSTPILNPPQVGILGMHKIEPRPVVVNGEVVVRPMMYIALSYDHRLVDGESAVKFLVKVKELIEDPETLLLEG